MHTSPVLGVTPVTKIGVFNEELNENISLFIFASR